MEVGSAAEADKARADTARAAREERIRISFVLKDKGAVRKGTNEAQKWLTPAQMARRTTESYDVDESMQGKRTTLVRHSFPQFPCVEAIRLRKGRA